MKLSPKAALLNGILVSIISFLAFAPMNLYFGLFMALAILLITFGFIPMPAGVLGVNYVPSALAKAQAKLMIMFQASELRAVDPQTYKAFRMNSEIMMPSHKILRTREDRALEAYYKKRTLRALGSGRSHNPSGNKGDTGVLTPSFSTYNDTFSISLKQADNNIFSYEEMLANEIENLIKNFSEGNETTATDFLFNNRSAVNIAVAEGTFNAVTNAFEVVSAQNGNRAIQITDSVMTENKYGSMPLTVFCDAVSWNKFRFLAKQGESNATNTSFQFEGKKYVYSLYLTAKAIALGYTNGFWICVPDGTIGVMDWIPKQNRTGVTKTPYNYGTFLNPIDGLDYAVFTLYTAQDGTATGGYTQDILDTYEFSIDLAFEKAPLTTANETTIQAFALV